MTATPPAIHARRPPPRRTDRSLSQPKAMFARLAAIAPATTVAVNRPIRAALSIASTLIGSSRVSSGR
ncbi:MAG: hypothetical protein PGN08_10870 [Sphingomonas taxi]